MVNLLINFTIDLEGIIIMVRKYIFSLAKLWHPYNRPEVINAKRILACNQYNPTNSFVNSTDCKDYSRSSRLTAGL